MRHVKAVLTIGASGLIGGEVVRESARHDLFALGTYRNLALPGLTQFDSSRPDTLLPLLERTQADAVVYCAGWTWVDGCEGDPQRAFRENATEPAAVARLCHERGIHFSYLSSSYVFDGVDGEYAEDSAPNPINVYGRAKLEGEQRILDACGGAALIARVICVYGPEVQRKNFAYQVWRAVQQGTELVLPKDQLGNPTYAGDIARWLIALVRERASGVRHLPGPNPNCTRGDWARELIAALCLCGIKPQPGFALIERPTADLKQPAPRPLRAGIVSKFALDAPLDLPSVVRLMVQGSEG